MDTYTDMDTGTEGHADTQTYRDTDRHPHTWTPGQIHTADNNRHLGPGTHTQIQT